MKFCYFLEIFFLTLTFFIISCSSYHEINKTKNQQNDKCFSYEENITLHGKLLQKEIPEIAERKGHYWILKIAEPICTQISKDEDLYQPYKQQTELQVAWKEYNTKMGFLNKEVIIYGKLFSAHTGHHWTNVLIHVEKIEIKNEIH